MIQTSNPTMILFAFLCALFATVVLGQIDASQFPRACMSQCQSLLNLAQTCTTEYGTTGTPPPSSACICTGLSTSSFSTNLNTCTSCLNTNDQQVGQAVSGLASYCSTLTSGCAFECGFPTCSSTDVGCQCKESYLQEIYNCAACNSARGITNSTQISDYNALRDSCVHQGYTSTPTNTEPIPSPSGTISYTGGASQTSGSATSPTMAGMTTTHTTFTSTGSQESMSTDTVTSFSILGGAVGPVAPPLGLAGVGYALLALGMIAGHVF